MWSEKGFVVAKKSLCNFPIMMAPDLDKSFSSTIDARNVGAGAVFMQEDDQGMEHPVCYFSKKLSAARRNYSAIITDMFTTAT